MSDGERRARIITFYSYKGGTGRSMALANVAWILASLGKRVLAIDWDLEAPGLHRYFHPFLEDKELAFSDGVIDFVMKYSREAAKPPTGREDWYVPLANLRRYACSLRYPFAKPGTVDLVPAGRQGPDYATRVNSFNWQNFYERLDGGAFLEAAKRSLNEYDFVLVDSRTGVSDTSGICTVQMPDTLVICFTPNTQSIEGAAAVAESALAQRLRADQKPGLMIYPVMTRVMQGETERVKLARQIARRRFDPMMWQIPERHREAYWGTMSVGHVDYYGFEEVLAVFGDEPNHPNTMLASMEAIAGYLVRTREEAEAEGESAGLAQPIQFPALKEPERKRLQALFVRQPAAVPAAPPVRVKSPAPVRAPEIAGRESELYWFYFSYARGDDDPLVRKLFDRLQEEVRALAGGDAGGFFGTSMQVADFWADEKARALASARTFIPLLSPAYLASTYCGKEFALFRSRSANSNSGATGILPMLWVPLRDEPLPTALTSIQMWDGSFPDEYRKRGARQLLSLSRRRDDFESFIHAFGRIVVQAAKSANVPELRSVPPMESVGNAFEQAGRGDAARARSTVNFVFLAPTRDEAERAGIPATAYGESPGSWRPFEQRVEQTAAQTTARMKLFYREIPASEDLTDRLHDAERELQPSIVLIDVEALRIDRILKLAMRAAEFQLLGNCRFVTVEQQERKVRPIEPWNFVAVNFRTAVNAVSQSDLADSMQKAIDEIRLRLIAEYPQSRGKSSGSEFLPKL